MSKSSCITHNSRQIAVIIRQDYLAICDNNHCAAALLNIFEYWTNIKLGQQEQARIENEIADAGKADKIDDSLWIYKSIPELQKELMGLFGETKVGNALKIILDKGFITTRNNPKYGWDRKLQYLFNIELVQAVILRYGNRKTTTLKASKPRHASLENKAAIPKTTTKTPNEITSKNVTPDGLIPEIPHSKESGEQSQPLTVGEEKPHTPTAAPPLSPNDLIKAWADEYGYTQGAMDVNMATPDRLKKAKAMVKLSPLFTPENIHKFLQEKKAAGVKPLEFIWLMEPMTIWLQRPAKNVTQLDDSNVIPAGPPASPEVVEANRLKLKALMDQMVTSA